MKKLNINLTIEEWHSTILQNSNGNDFMFFSKQISNTIWFATNYLQFLSRTGNCEVMPIYGQLVSSLADFVCQVNCCFPVGYRLIPDSDALYDLLLNFETEPLRRIIFWNDADFYFKKDPAGFGKIFELLVISAYSNRNGISTTKEDGSIYLVDQRNLFCFKDMNLRDMEYLLARKYYIPSLQRDLKIDFEIIELVEGYGQ